MTKRTQLLCFGLTLAFCLLTALPCAMADQNNNNTTVSGTQIITQNNYESTTSTSDTALQAAEITKDASENGITAAVIGLIAAIITLLAAVTGISIYFIKKTKHSQNNDKTEE